MGGTGPDEEGFGTGACYLPAYPRGPWDYPTPSLFSASAGEHQEADEPAVFVADRPRYLPAARTAYSTTWPRLVKLYVTSDPGKPCWHQAWKYRARPVRAGFEGTV